MAWHHNTNDRDLPWKGEKDPYRIWLAEVILQQTRAQQGLPYYMSFTTTYPTVQALAAAADEDVFRLWQGLGYYNRCRNMLATARHIATQLNGHFPGTYAGLLLLKGIGPYTAAAIASFAYGLPHAVVDGNVYRVLSRYFSIDTPFDTTAGKKQFTEIADRQLDTTASAAYNQAIMDLGATVCTPAAPRCTDCPLSGTCVAVRQGTVALLPVRSKKVKVRERFFNYLLLQHKDEIWIQKREKGDIWEDLHQPLLVETASHTHPSTVAESGIFGHLPLNHHDIAFIASTSQRLTHQLIHTQFFNIRLKSKPDIQTLDGFWLRIDELKKLAFPKTLVSFFKNNLYF